MTLTKPEAGVIATNPATAPAAAPITLGCFLCHQLTVIQVRAAIAAAVFVTTKALVASAPAPSALHALKPTHQNQSSAAPSTVMVASCGSTSCLPNPGRRPSTSAAPRAETPELIWTTVPPAKSRAPRLWSQPPAPQTQWAIGS